MEEEWRMIERISRPLAAWLKNAPTLLQRLRNAGMKACWEYEIRMLDACPIQYPIDHSFRLFSSEVRSLLK